MQADWQQQLRDDGFALIPAVFTRDEIEGIVGELHRALHNAPPQAVLARNQRVYASRQLLRVFPAAKDLCHRQPLRNLLQSVLGSQCGLVRGLYFDKPPEQSWALPWHQDRGVAIRNEGLESPHFSKVRLKADVPHVEASREVLESMLSLRLHLDTVTKENGPLLVRPGSHRDGQPGTQAHVAHAVYAHAGDVLAIRPLLFHCSRNSDPQTTSHRRIIHLEFAAKPTLPDGFHWHEFHPLTQPDD